jgi:hypothetical protein
MFRRDLIRRVLEGVPSSGDSVAYPDHPLLLRGPDVLASMNGILTAYFVSTRKSRDQGPVAVATVVLSRLALPSRTNFVLVTDDDPEVEGRLVGLFEEIVSISKGRLDLPIGRLTEAQSVPAIEVLRKHHHARFAEAWDSTVDRDRKKKPRKAGRSTATVQMQRGNARKYVGKEMVFHDNHLIARWPNSEGRVKSRERLTDAASSAARLDFGLDLGSSGLSEMAMLLEKGDAFLAMHQNFANTVSHSRAFDNLKPLRGAAFAGFATDLEDRNAL